MKSVVCTPDNKSLGTELITVIMYFEVYYVYYIYISYSWSLILLFLSLHGSSFGWLVESGGSTLVTFSRFISLFIGRTSYFV